MRRLYLGLALVVLLAGCAGGGGTPPVASGDGDPAAAAPVPTASGERYALSSDAYPQQPPDVSRVPDAVPRVEAPSRAGNRPSYEVWGKTYHVLPDASGYVRRGTASWYGKKFHGYATSNGEIYDMYKMSAAHRSLPLPTFARVTSLDNGRSVIVRINDRGPFHSDREIDLSYAAAARLGILERGTGRVRVEAIDPRAWLAENGHSGEGASPAPVAKQGAATARSTATGDAATPERTAERRPADGGPLYLQVAALESARSARELQERLQDELERAVRVASAAGLHRVQVGPLEHAGQVAPLRGELRRAGFDQAFVVDADD